MYITFAFVEWNKIKGINCDSEFLISRWGWFSSCKYAFASLSFLMLQIFKSNSIHLYRVKVMIFTPRNPKHENCNINPRWKLKHDKVSVVRNRLTKNVEILNFENFTMKYWKFPKSFNESSKNILKHAEKFFFGEQLQEVNNTEISVMYPYFLKFSWLVGFHDVNCELVPRIDKDCDKDWKPESIPLYFQASLINLRRMIEIKILINSAMDPIANEKNIWASEDSHILLRHSQCEVGPRRNVRPFKTSEVTPRPGAKLEFQIKK
jgi:hypothetical protein